MRRLAWLLTLAALMPPAVAQAGDYPFVGQYTAAGEATAPQPNDPQRCVLNFFQQNADGSFIAYHADLPHFHKTGQVRYMIYQRGSCAYDQRARIETCHMAFDTDPEVVGTIYENVLEDIRPDFVRATGFDEIEQADSYARSGNKGEGYPNSYVHCPFDDARLAAALTNRDSDLSPDDRELYTTPGDEVLGRKDVSDMARQMGLLK